MKSDDIIVGCNDGIATITFNRPDSRNAIDYQGWLHLRQIAHSLADDNQVKVVVLMGSGEEAFSAGADIKDFERHRSDSQQAKIYSTAFDGAMDAIEALPKPTISVIKGFCVGGGCELSMATDIRIAADNSSFGIPVARLGILLGYREMRRLVNLVGPGHAAHILLSGRLIDAHEAMRIGLVNRVEQLGQIENQAFELAREMVLLAPLSQSRHKKMIQMVLRNPGLRNLTAREESMPFANFDSLDFKEGCEAFLERRRAKFIGE